MMKSLLLPAASVAALVLFGSSAQAVTVNFTNNASFDSNFYKPAGATGATLLTQTGSSLHFTPTTGKTVAAAIYNTTTSGGSGGSGGTTFGTPTPTFTINSTGYVIESTYKTSSATFDGANGVGIYFGLNSGATSGECALFRLSTVTGNTGNADVRFCSAANATTAGAGSVGGSNSFGTTVGLGLQVNTYYTFQLTVKLNGSNIDMTAKLLNEAGTAQIGSTITASILASSVTATNGQVGFRVGGVQNSIGDVSRFSITAVPEPTSVGVAFGLGLGALVVLRVRSQRRLS